MEGLFWGEKFHKLLNTDEQSNFCQFTIFKGKKIYYTLVIILLTNSGANLHQFSVMLLVVLKGQDKVIDSNFLLLSSLTKTNFILIKFNTISVQFSP